MQRPELPQGAYLETRIDHLASHCKSNTFKKQIYQCITEQIIFIKSVQSQKFYIMELHREGQRHSPDSMPNPRQILRDIHAKVARRKMSKNIVVEQKLRQNLVIVCCHAIWKGKGDCGDAEDEW